LLQPKEKRPWGGLFLISMTWRRLKQLDTQFAEGCDGLPFGQVALPH